MKSLITEVTVGNYEETLANCVTSADFVKSNNLGPAANAVHVDPPKTCEELGKCLNEGTCLPMGLDRVYCDCEEGWTGDNCQ